MRFLFQRLEEHYTDTEDWLESVLPHAVSLDLAAKQRIWQQAQQAARTYSPSPHPKPRRIWKLAYPFFSLLLLLGFLGGYVGIVFASGASIPGDSLYTVERQIEALWMKLTPSTQQDEVRLVLLERRLYEVRALLDSGRDVPENLFQEVEMLFLSLNDNPSPQALPQMQHDRDMLRRLNEQHPGIYALQKALDAAESATASLESQ